MGCIKFEKLKKLSVNI